MNPQERQFLIGSTLALIVAIGIWAVGLVLWKKGRIRYKTFFYVVTPLGGLCFGVPMILLLLPGESFMCQLSALIPTVMVALFGPYFMIHYLRLVRGVDVRRYYDDNEKHDGQK
jgi:hypothetical protein